MEDGEAAASDLARQIGAPLSQVTHHMRFLERHGAVEFVRSEEVPRGTPKRYYRRTTRPWANDDEYAAMDVGTRRALSNETIAETVGEIAAAVDEDRFAQRADSHVSRSPLLLDPQGWAQVRDLLGEVLERIHEIAGEAANRAATTDEELESFRMVLMLFEAPKSVSDYAWRARFEKP
jgi:DNA-binding transcriptional ArsR family regulator